MGVIYKITSPSNKIYVGKTYNLNRRVASHKWAATRTNKNILLHNSIRKYGWEAHVLEVIEELADELMDEREMFWIAELKTYCHENKMGLNMTKGGDGQRSTWMHKTELRKYFSDKFTGKGNPFYGKKHTEENKKQQSIRAKEWALKNKTTIPEWGAEKGRNVVRKPIIVYNSKGIFVGEYISLTDGAKKLSTSISSVKDSALYGSWINGTYLVKYKTDNYPLTIEVNKITVRNVKRPIYLLDDNFDVIVEYPSAQEANIFCGIPRGSINRAALGNPLKSGHIFLYKDLYKNIMQEVA
tara:strand:+ start:15752 stop:16645 length:894 start_codon:yes stop_codon:yes gene_type:complete